MLISKDRLAKILKYSQIIFYLTFLFLWFKDNFPAFKKISISYLFALIPLVIITVIRIFFVFRYKRRSFKIKINNKAFLGLVIILLIAVAVRLPFLIHHFGLLDSDDVLPILVGKHISEGKPPPVYHYGQEYLGTFPYHIYALMFKIFGYSILVVLLVSFIFYLAFIIIQFVFFKEIFSSSTLSLILCSFYCLPIGHLLAVSFHIGISFSLVLFLSSLSMYVSFLIYKGNKENLIPFLGFWLGVLFWIHPITIAFAISSFILIALKIRLRLRKYFNLIFYGLIGGFPFILSEIGHEFDTLKYIFSGRRIQSSYLEKLKGTIGHVIFLVSSENNFLNIIYIFLIFLGMIAIVYLSLKRKRFLSENILAIFSVVFLGVFILSRYSSVHIVHTRYLYPLYFVLPFLLVSILYLLRGKIKYILMIGLFLIIVIFSNLKDTSRSYSYVKRAHGNLKKIISAMEKTGEKYWVGDFWQAFLITGLSGEEIICWSYPHERYFPYKLLYFNQGENNNFVVFNEPGSYAVKFKKMFHHIAGNLARDFKRADHLITLLERLKVEAKKNRIGDFCWLIHDISAQVFPWAIEKPVPLRILDVQLADIEDSRGYLFMTFNREEAAEVSGFWLHVEIPGFSSVARRIPSDKGEIKLRIPFPREESVQIKYYLNYRGTKILSTTRELAYSLLPGKLKERKQRVVYLSGFGPEAKVHGQKMRVCEKEVRFEINKPVGSGLKIRLHLYSPFQFSHPFWYGEYSQEVKVELNDQHLTERKLDDGKNVINLDIKGPHLRRRVNIITLKFKYHLPFRFAPRWKTSALLDKIEVE